MGHGSSQPRVTTSGHRSSPAARLLLGFHLDSSSSFRPFPTFRGPCLPSTGWNLRSSPRPLRAFHHRPPHHACPRTPARKCGHTGFLSPFPLLLSLKHLLSLTFPMLQASLHLHACVEQRGQRNGIKTGACSARPGPMKRWLSCGYPYLPSGGSRGPKLGSHLEKRGGRGGVCRESGCGLGGQ